MNTRLRVLVTGARAPVALHVCRLFNQYGADVYATDSISFPLTKVSNSIKRFILTPSPKFETEKYMKAIVNLVKDERIDYLIPTCEEIFYISMYRDEIERYCKVLVDDFSKLKTLHNKFEFIEMSATLGFEVPLTTILDSHDKIEHRLEENKLVMKKIYSRFSDSVVFISSPEEIPTMRFKDSRWILQDRISGEQFCSYSIAKNGKILAHSVYKSNFTAGLGATISFEHHDRKDIEQFVSKVVEYLNFTGQISFDFIVNDRNHAIPIECNPRSTSGLHLFDQEVVNALILQSEKCLFPHKGKKETIKLAMFLYGVPQVRTIHKLREWVKVVISYKDNIFRIRDPFPYFYQIVSLMKIWRDSKKNDRTLLQKTTFDISWDGDE